MYTNVTRPTKLQATSFFTLDPWQMMFTTETISFNWVYIYIFTGQTTLIQEGILFHFFSTTKSTIPSWMSLLSNCLGQVREVLYVPSIRHPDQSRTQ